MSSTVGTPNAISTALQDAQDKRREHLHIALTVLTKLAETGGDPQVKLDAAQAIIDYYTVR